jgi:hypothetical protein
VVSKYDLLFYFNYSGVVPLIGKHFSEHDLKLWKKRGDYLKSLVNTIRKKPKSIHRFHLSSLNTRFISIDSIDVLDNYVTGIGDYIAKRYKK